MKWLVQSVEYIKSNYFFNTFNYIFFIVIQDHPSWNTVREKLENPGHPGAHSALKDMRANMQKDNKVKDAGISFFENKE